MASVILGSSYHADVYSAVDVSDKFGVNLLFDAIKRGCDIMIDSCDWQVLWPTSLPKLYVE